MNQLHKYFDTALEIPDGIKKLRELILTLAMQGKLVEQNPKDQPASELLKEIQSEKNKLIASGKIKKQEPLPPIKPDEIPYPLPAGWTRARLGDIVSLLGDGLHGTPNYDDFGDYYFINGNNLSDGRIEIKENTKKISVSEYHKYKKDLNAKTVFISINGTIGNVAFYNNEKIILGKSACYFNLFENIDKGFIKKLINSKYFIDYAFSFATGTTIKNVSLKTMREFIVPLPPLAEQKRIVAKIDSLMALCDKLEAEQKTRNDKRITIHTSSINNLVTAQDNKSFSKSWGFITKHFDELYSVPQNVSELKKTILQLAVMGKLVEQNPKDQPASELLKEIQSEKNKLIASGKIKKQEPLPPIKADEIPYPLPAGWEWVRFFDINYVKSELVNPKDYPNMFQIAPDSIEKGSGKLLFDRTVFESRVIGPNNKFYKGQILYSKIRPSLSKAVIAPYDGLCSSDMYPIVTLIEPYFALKTILSEPFLDQVRVAENRIKMPKLNLESLGSFLVPLPPLAEQKRIVAKIDSLMALCDMMNQQLTTATVKQSKIFDAVLSKV